MKRPSFMQSGCVQIEGEGILRYLGRTIAKFYTNRFSEIEYVWLYTTPKGTLALNSNYFVNSNRNVLGSPKGSFGLLTKCSI